MKEDYVSFETAKLLKEKGFPFPSTNFEDGLCCMYDENGDIKWGCYHPDWYVRVTHQMAMKWLREEYNIIFVFKPAYFSGDNCTFWTYELWCGDNFEGEFLSFKSYEEAVEAALQNVLCKNFLKS